MAEEIEFHFNQRVKMDGVGGVCTSFVRSAAGYVWYFIKFDNETVGWHYAHELTAE